MADRAGPGTGFEFQTELVAWPQGGGSEAANGTLRIQKADAVTFIVTLATSYLNHTNIGDDPPALCRQILSRAAAKDYATLPN